MAFDKNKIKKCCKKKDVPKLTHAGSGILSTCRQVLIRVTTSSTIPRYHKQSIWKYP